MVSRHWPPQGIHRARFPARGQRQIYREWPPTKEYFPNHAWEHDATEPLKFTSLVDQVDVVLPPPRAAAWAGNPGRCAWDCPAPSAASTRSCVPALRKNGFLTRDSRMKERKKYGQKGARKRFQFTKR